MKRNLINCLVTKSNIEVSMSFEQWRLYENGELNLVQIKMMNDVDFELFKLDPIMYRSLVVIISILLFYFSTGSIAFASGLDAIPALGQRFLDIVRTGMYWVCLVKGCLDVGKEVTRGGDNLGNIGKIIMKYTLAFATLYIMPTCFDTVKEAFGQ